MRHSKIYFIVILLLGIMFAGFDCGSAGIESAKLYIQQKNYEKAIEVLQKEIEKNPQSDEAYFLMGRAYAELNDMEKMADAFDKSLSISNKFAEDIKEYRSYYWANSFNKGVNLFNRGNQSTDKDSAKIYYDLSIKNYKDAIMIIPDSTETYRNLAFVYLTTGQNEESIEPLKKLIEYKHSEDGYKYLGQVYYTIGSNKMNEFINESNQQDSIKAMDYFNNAISVLEEGQKKYPENEDISAILTSAYVSADKIDFAMNALKQSVEKDPNNKSNHYNYGVLLLGAGRYEEAEQQFLKALELDPDYENATYNLGVTYVKWGTEINKKAEDEGIISEDYKEKYQKALPYLEKVVTTESANAQIWELLGKVYSVLGMQDKATDAFNKADELR